jgi:hypothetical protein
MAARCGPARQLECPARKRGAHGKGPVADAEVHAKVVRAPAHSRAHVLGDALDGGQVKDHGVLDAGERLEPSRVGAEEVDAVGAVDGAKLDHAHGLHLGRLERVEVDPGVVVADRLFGADARVGVVLELVLLRVGNPVNLARLQ